MTMHDPADLLFPDGIDIPEDKFIEKSAVRRIVGELDLPTVRPLETFKQLVDAGFPLPLRAYKFKPRVLEQLLITLQKRPTKSEIWTAYSDFAGAGTEAGIVFNWPGYGGIHVFHNFGTLGSNCYKLGTFGWWFTIQKNIYWLETIPSLCKRIGPSSDW